MVPRSWLAVNSDKFLATSGAKPSYITLDIVGTAESEIRGHILWEVYGLHVSSPRPSFWRSETSVVANEISIDMSQSLSLKISG